MDEPKARIEKGINAELSKEYIFNLLSRHEEEIYNNLSNDNANLEELRGMSKLIKKIKSDVERDISQGISAKNHLKKNK